MDLIKTNLKRAREEENLDSKNRKESDMFWMIRGMVSVWADDDGISNKRAYAVDILNRIKQLNEEFKEDELIRMPPSEKKFRGI